jgi:hypothetical protein
MDIDKFYTKLDFQKQNKKETQRYSGKGVRTKTNMIQHWKNNPKMQQKLNKSKKIKIKLKLQTKKKSSAKNEVVPKSIRKLQKWNYPRTEKDSYQNLIGGE